LTGLLIYTNILTYCYPLLYLKFIDTHPDHRKVSSEVNRLPAGPEASKHGQKTRLLKHPAVDI